MSDLYGEQYLSEEQEDFIDALFENARPNEQELTHDDIDIRDKMADNRYTCFDCEDRFDCQYAFDDYNTNGHCLALK